jgi:phage FluMu gp28-like protein
VATVGKVWTPTERLNYLDAMVKVDERDLALDFWQESYIKLNNRFVLVLKSRRTGFSFAAALKGTAKAQDPARIKYTKQYISYNEDDAKEKINYAREFYYSIPKKWRKPIVSDTKTQLEFLDKNKKTTSRLISIACRPPRGKGGDICFDEMGIYPSNKARIIYTAGLPVIARGGCLEAGSTPLGKIGTFYDICVDRQKYGEYARLNVPWWVSSALCNNVEEAVKLAAHMDTEDRVELFGLPALKAIYYSMFLEDFQQEFECTFVDSASSYITLDLIHANTPGMREEDRTAELPDDSEEPDIEIHAFHTADDLILGYDPAIHGRIYAGYDVARRRDAAVVFVIGITDNGKCRSVAEIEMTNTKFEVQMDCLRKILKNLPVVRVCMDQTGQGEPLCEKLQDEFGSSKIEGILFTPESKEVLAIGVRAGLEKSEFLLQNDPKFHKQIHSIKRIATLAGRFRYDAQRDDSGHADSFWAWALAYHAVSVIAEAHTKPNFYKQYAAKKRGEAIPVTVQEEKKVSRPRSAAAVLARMGRTRK